MVTSIKLFNASSPWIILIDANLTIFAAINGYFSISISIDSERQFFNCRIVQNIDCRVIGCSSSFGINFRHLSNFCIILNCDNRFFYVLPANCYRLINFGFILNRNSCRIFKVLAVVYSPRSDSSNRGSTTTCRTTTCHVFNVCFIFDCNGRFSILPANSHNPASSVFNSCAALNNYIGQPIVTCISMCITQATNCIVSICNNANIFFVCRFTFCADCNIRFFSIPAFSNRCTVSSACSVNFCVLLD